MSAACIWTRSVVFHEIAVLGLNGEAPAKGESADINNDKRPDLAGTGNGAGIRRYETPG